MSVKNGNGKNTGQKMVCKIQEISNHAEYPFFRNCDKKGPDKVIPNRDQQLPDIVRNALKDMRGTLDFGNVLEAFTRANLVIAGEAIELGGQKIWKFTRLSKSKNPTAILFTTPDKLKPFAPESALKTAGF